MYDPTKIKGTNHRDIEALHPKVGAFAKEFLIKANEIAKQSNAEVRLTSTLRTWEEQAAIYAKGRTSPGLIVSNAKPGSSMHNWGAAFDIGVFKDGKYLGVSPIYSALGPIGEAMGLTWGGRFTKPVDLGHYQYTGKLSGSKFLAVVNSTNVDGLLNA